jgi:hypothetical protein
MDTSFTIDVDGEYEVTFSIHPHEPTNQADAMLGATS